LQILDRRATAGGPVPVRESGPLLNRDQQFYVVDGVEYCWLHRLPLSGSYRVSDDHFFTVYGWRGQEAKFPLAKLYEAHETERSSGTNPFCPDCQKEYERWLAAEHQRWPAEDRSDDRGAEVADKLKGEGE